MLTFQLQWLAKALFTAYLISVFAEAFPLKIADPNWRLNLIDTLVNNGTIPLIGLGVAHLAAYLDTSRSDALALWRRVSHLAVLASLGFVLIVPIQIGTSISLYTDLSASRFKEINRADQGLINLANAIQKSATVDQLESTLLTLQGSALSDNDRTQPLANLKKLLLNRIAEARKVLEARRRQQTLAAPLDPTLLIRRSLRVGLTSLVFCLAFAAGAQLPRSPFSLLEEWRIGALDVQAWIATRIRLPQWARQDKQKVRWQEEASGPAAAAQAEIPGSEAASDTDPQPPPLGRN
ncbi:MAG: HpsJ family protein [Cyanobacteriota bacterium]|jgi:hypothetical protein